MNILGQIARFIREVKVDLANKTFESLVDTDTSNANPNDILIYANGKWTSNSSSIFGLIDGGFSDSQYQEVLNIDGGSA